MLVHWNPFVWFSSSALTHKHTPTWRSHRLFCWISTLGTVLYMQAFQSSQPDGLHVKRGEYIHGAVQRETWLICHASCLNPANSPDSSLTSCLLIEGDGSALWHHPDVLRGMQVVKLTICCILCGVSRCSHWAISGWGAARVHWRYVIHPLGMN